MPTKSLTWSKAVSITRVIRYTYRGYCFIFIADLTCADKPCQNGGVCTDATKSCSQDTDRACGFTCECPAPLAGRFCHLYRRCFADVRLCYQTDYEKHDYNRATKQCLLQGDITKPVILNHLEAFDLRVFVEDDPMGRLIHDSVWLAAEASQQSVDDVVNSWQWLDGLTTSRWPIRYLCAVYLRRYTSCAKKDWTPTHAGDGKCCICCMDLLKFNYFIRRLNNFKCRLRFDAVAAVS